MVGHPFGGAKRLIWLDCTHVNILLSSASSMIVISRILSHLLIDFSFLDRVLSTYFYWCKGSTFFIISVYLV